MLPLSSPKSTKHNSKPLALTFTGSSAASFKTLPAPTAPKGPAFSGFPPYTFFNMSALTGAAAPVALAAPNTSLGAATAAAIANTVPLAAGAAVAFSAAPRKPIEYFTPLKLPKYFSSNNLKQQIYDEEFTIYPLDKLHILLAEMKNNNEPPVLRFLVDSNKTVWFARENGKIPSPAHFKMTGNPQNKAYCITAGNIFLSPDFKTLIKFNNKSGDFEPEFDSLKWFIAILLINITRLPFALSQTVEVEMFQHQALTQRLIWSWDALKQMLKELFYPTSINALKQPQLEPKEVTYKKNSGAEIPKDSSIDIDGEPPVFSMGT